MNPDIQPVNTSSRVVSETQPVFLTHEASPVNRPSDDDIQKTLDTLEKETEKTYVYNNSKLFRRKIEKQSSLESSDPDASNRSSDGEGDNSESSSNTYFLDDSTEDAPRRDASMLSIIVVSLFLLFFFLSLRGCARIGDNVPVISVCPG